MTDLAGDTRDARRIVARWVSGGQTGVDRALLDAAVALGEPYGGWCPAGGWAEDLPEPPGLLAAYPGLRPTTSGDPAERTWRNVRDSDATLVLDARGGRVSPGTELTIEAARSLGRPVLRLDLRGLDSHGLDLRGLELRGLDDRDARSGLVGHLTSWVLRLPALTVDERGATEGDLQAGGVRPAGGASRMGGEPRGVGRARSGGRGGLVLHVAGPRESEAPGTYDRARPLLLAAMRGLRAAHEELRDRRSGRGHYS